MEIYKKLQQARKIIAESEVKKLGHNKFSEYDYFTPEQINGLVSHAEQEAGIMTTFELVKIDTGITGILNIIDIETGENIQLKQLTDIPQIKATNSAQMIGGAVTYTRRYMLMTAYAIADNSLDFDANEPEANVKPTAKPAPPPAPPARTVTGDIPEHAKMKIPEKAFGQLCEKLKANPNPTDRGNLLAKTRRYYLPFTSEQEEIISQITDNL